MYVIELFKNQEHNKQCGYNNVECTEHIRSIIQCDMHNIIKFR